MAITWGAWAYANGNGQRCGIEISRNGNSIAVGYYVQNQWQHYDNGEISTRSGAIGGSSTFNNNGGPNAIIGITTQYLTGGPGGTYTFGHTITKNYHGARPSVSASVSIPINAPNRPSKVSATRVSDTQHTISISHGSSGGGNPIQKTAIERSSLKDPTWRRIATLNNAASSYSDTGTKPDDRYRWRVRAENTSGQSAFVDSANVFTTPATAKSLTAAKLDDLSIELKFANGASYDPTSFEIRDNGTVVGTVPGTARAWTHANPNASVTHTYTVVAIQGALRSAASTPSNTVQLLAKPLVPSEIAPNGAAVALEGGVRLSWKHNPVDTTAQTAYRLTYRHESSLTWTTLTGTSASFRDIALQLGVYEWQVATKGQHADYSDPSPVATITVINRPGVAIIAPTPVWGTRVVTASWSWQQAQGRPQSGWIANLSTIDGVLETKSGRDAAKQVTFATRLEDDVEYTVTVSAATGDVWSVPTAQTFVVIVPPASPAIVQGSWDESSGTVALAVEDGRGPEVAPVRNYFTNPRIVGDGTWTEVRRGLIANAGFENGQVAFWGSNAGYSGVSMSIVPAEVGYGNHALRVDCDGNRTFLGINQTNTVVREFTALTGDSWAVSAWVKVPLGRVLTMSLQKRTSANVYVDDVRHDFVGTDQWMKITATRSGYAAGERATVFFAFKDAVAGTFFIDDVMAEYGTTVGEYFDLTTPPEVFDSRYRIVQIFPQNGTALMGALEGENARGFSGSNCHAFVSTFAGKPAVRLVATSPTLPNSGARFIIPATATRDGGVWMGTRHLREPLTGQLHASRQGTYAYYGVSNEVYASPAQANLPGSYEHSISYPSLGSSFVAALGHGGMLGAPDVWWTDIGLFDTGYEGPAFSGADSLVKVKDSWLAPAWDGEVDDSTSTARMTPVTVRTELERSTDGGNTWRTITTEGVLPINLTDAESLSNGRTLYRATTITADGGSTITVGEVESDSGSVWLSGGVGFSWSVRLPYDPEVALTGGRERVIRRYAGRPLPVTHAGEALTRVVPFAGTLHLEECTPDELLDLVQDPEPVHLYRDPDSRLIYGSLSELQSQRESHADWSYSLQITQTSA